MGPPTSATVTRGRLGRGGDACRVRSPRSTRSWLPNGAAASAKIDPGDGTVHVRVRCGDPLDEVVLRSYCIGAAHMALGWVRSESIAVGSDGVPLDLTIRSFGVLRAVDTPRIEVEIVPRPGDGSAGQRVRRRVRGRRGGGVAGGRIPGPDPIRVSPNPASLAARPTPVRLGSVGFMVTRIVGRHQ